MVFTAYIETLIPYIPKIRVIATDIGVSRIILPFQKDFEIDNKTSHFLKKDADIFGNLKKQFDLYANGLLTEFTIPLDIQGTLYQKKIWTLLQTIPYGETASYKKIADKADSAPRAVGGANRMNPVPIIIPCHRVINHNGTLGGYFGVTENHNAQEINLKKILLTIEKSNIPKKNINS